MTTEYVGKVVANGQRSARQTGWIRCLTVTKI
jgi:hypothetical protein